MIYTINYRLHKVGKNYNGLYEGIKNLSGIYWHNTTSSWIVQSNLSAKEIFQRLRIHIDSNDELVVFRLHGEYYGQLQDDDRKWLQTRSELWVGT